jgi:hypothetical protein
MRWEPEVSRDTPNFCPFKSSTELNGAFLPVLIAQHNGDSGNGGMKINFEKIGTQRMEISRIHTDVGGNYSNIRSLGNIFRCR